MFCSTAFNTDMTFNNKQTKPVTCQANFEADGSFGGGGGGGGGGLLHLKQIRLDISNESSNDDSHRI